MRRFRNLERSLDQITAGPDMWILPWLSAIGSREEIAEWKAIRRTYRGPDLRDREREFTREMRRRHPDMPLTFDEIVEEGGRQYAASELARQGIAEAPTENERPDLTLAIKTLVESHGTASLQSLPATQRTAWLRVNGLYEKLKQEGKMN